MGWDSTGFFYRIKDPTIQKIEKNQRIPENPSEDHFHATHIFAVFV